MERAASRLFEKGAENFIQFDQEKIKLIHFHSKRNIDENQFTISLGDYTAKPQKVIKWLGIYLDCKLTFKDHVSKKVSEATRMFHQIERLSNTERGLSF